MTWRVVALTGEHGELIAGSLSAQAAQALCWLLRQLQTDADPRRYVIRGDTGF